MLFTTTTQWVALAIALVAGWLFGLASHPGGRKWKDRYAAERAAHTATRKEYDDRIAATRREHDARIAEANARHTERESERARMATAAPAAAAPTASVTDRLLMRDRDHAAPTRTPIAGTTGGRGWFDWKNRVGTNG